MKIMEKTKSDSRGRQVAKVLPAQTALTMTSELALTQHISTPYPYSPMAKVADPFPLGKSTRLSISCLALPQQRIIARTMNNRPRESCNTVCQ